MPCLVRRKAGRLAARVVGDVEPSDGTREVDMVQRAEGLAFALNSLDGCVVALRDFSGTGAFGSTGALGSTVASVESPAVTTWACLDDIESVVACIPGAELTGRRDDGSYEGLISFRLLRSGARAGLAFRRQGRPGLRSRGISQSPPVSS